MNFNFLRNIHTYDLKLSLKLIKEIIDDNPEELVLTLNQNNIRDYKFAVIPLEFSKYSLEENRLLVEFTLFMRAIKCFNALYNNYQFKVTKQMFTSACAGGDISVVRRVIDIIKENNDIDQNYYSLGMSAACYFGNIDVVKYLYSKRVDVVSFKSSFIPNPISSAVKGCQYDVIEFIMEQCLTPYVKEKLACLAIQYLLKSWDTTTFEYLLRFVRDDHLKDIADSIKGKAANDPNTYNIFIKKGRKDLLFPIFKSLIAKNISNKQVYYEIEDIIVRNDENYIDHFTETIKSMPVYNVCKECIFSLVDKSRIDTQYIVENCPYDLDLFNYFISRKIQPHFAQLSSLIMQNNIYCILSIFDKHPKEFKEAMGDSVVIFADALAGQNNLNSILLDEDRVASMINTFGSDFIGMIGKKYFRLATRYDSNCKCFMSLIEKKIISKKYAREFLDASILSIPIKIDIMKFLGVKMPVNSQYCDHIDIVTKYYELFEITPEGIEYIMTCLLDKEEFMNFYFANEQNLNDNGISEGFCVHLLFKSGCSIYQLLIDSYLTKKALQYFDLYKDVVNLPKSDLEQAMLIKETNDPNSKSVLIDLITDSPYFYELFPFKEGWLTARLANYVVKERPDLFEDEEYIKYLINNLDLESKEILRKSYPLPYEDISEERIEEILSKNILDINEIGDIDPNIIFQGEYLFLTAYQLGSPLFDTLVQRGANLNTLSLVEGIPVQSIIHK